MFVLLAMVLVASAQALFFNIAERDVAWAQSLLDGLSWADTFLQKGTLWLALIGASLATQQDRHIAIDVLPKIAPPRARAVMRFIASLGASVTAFILARVFFQACLIADASVPFEYEVLTAEGPAHVCDVPPAELGATSRPDALCALRAAFGAAGVRVASGGGIAQLIVPLMFSVIGLRLAMRALISGRAALRGGEGPGGEDPDDSAPNDSGDAPHTKDADEAPSTP